MSSRDEFVAVVTNIQDPEKKGRIKVKCNALLAGGEEIPEWIPPKMLVASSTCVLFIIPKVGDEVHLTCAGSSSDLDFGGEGMVTDPEWAYEGSPWPEGVTLPASLGDDYGNRIALYSVGDNGSEAYFMLDRAAATALVVADRVQLGTFNAQHPVSLADLLKPIVVSLFQSVQTTFNAHIHPVPALGTSGTPTVPMALSLTDLQGSSWSSNKVFAPSGSDVSSG